MISRSRSTISRTATDCTRPCGECRFDLLPEDGREFESDEAVEDAPGLLGIDEIHVDGPGFLDGLEDGAFGDFVEYDPLGPVDGEPQHFGEVPCDGFSFAVFIGGEPYGFGFGEFGEFVDDLFLVGGDFVDGFEALFDIDAEILFCEVADVSEARFDDVVLAEELFDGLGLGRGLDDN